MSIIYRIVFSTLLMVFSSSTLLSSFALADRTDPRENILKSASELDYPPFALVRSDGSADGFSVDLLKAVAAAIHYKLKLEVGPWNTIKTQLARGELDVLPLVAHSEEREKYYDFTVPYLQMHGTIFIRTGEQSIRTGADLKDKEVLVMQGDTAHEYAVRNNISKNLILTESYETAIRLLSEGKYDAVICQYLVGLQLIKKLKISNVVSVAKQNELSVKPTGRPLEDLEQRFCFAVPEGNKELQSILNEGLAIVFANGTYEKLYLKWFEPILPKPKVPFSSLLRSMSIAFVPLLLIIAVFGVWFLKREVEVKTQTLKKEIREREKTEAELKKSEEELEERVEKRTAALSKLTQEFNALLDAIPDILLHVSRKGRIFWANRGASDLLNVELSSMVGRSFVDVLPAQQGEYGEAVNHENPVKKTIREDRSIEALVTLPNSRTVQFRSFPIRGNSNKIRNIILVGVDITEKLSLEAQALRTRHLSSLGELAAGVAHEINNPINGIINYGQLIVNKSKGESWESDIASRIIKEGDRIATIVRSLLSFAKGRDDEEKEATKIAEILNEALSLTGTQLRHDNIQVNVSISPQANTVFAIANKIEQVFLNLISNSRFALNEKYPEASPEKVIEITSDNAFIMKKSMVRVSFKDNGTGIEKDIMQNIFNPFYSTKAGDKGTGLGLSISLGIIEDHGGRISVESKEGSFTDVSIYLPDECSTGSTC